MNVPVKNCYTTLCVCVCDRERENCKTHSELFSGSNLFYTQQMDMQTSAHTHAHACACTHTQTHMHKHVHTHTHPNTHTYTRTPSYARMCIYSQLSNTCTISNHTPEHCFQTLSIRIMMHTSPDWVKKKKKKNPHHCLPGLPTGISHSRYSETTALTKSNTGPQSDFCWYL